MEGIEIIKEENRIYAIIIRKEFNQPGVNFFTPEEFSQQLGALVHKKGKIVDSLEVFNVPVKDTNYHTAIKKYLSEMNTRLELMKI